MRIKTLLAFAALSSLFAAVPANAATYTFDGDNLGGNKTVGDHTNITTTYNTSTDLFTWSSTFTDNGNGPLAEGAWLVISDGENPKKNADEYAIFYLDGTQNTVSIYNYNGANSANSYQSETFLASTTLDVTNSGNSRTFEFSFDATDLNDDIHGLFGSEWKGITFDESIGIWFHGAGNLSTSYDTDGSLLTFSPTATGWYDTKNKTTTAVPEPASLVAIGLFAVGAATKLRKRN